MKKSTKKNKKTFVVDPVAQALMKYADVVLWLEDVSDDEDTEKK